ncbi:MAG: hypothetical protein KAH05_07975 [Clostridiales bacterium]|nr:hypothetical protein [Clostridiales bacterium]
MRILEGLKRISDENLISFHMPGHKNGRLLSSYFSEYFKYDITEIPGADNLHNPIGMIKKTEEMISEYYASDKSYIIVNGSTAGIYSAVMVITKPGDKLIISRECHRSVYSALILGGIEAEYIYPEIDSKSGAINAINVEVVKENFMKYPEAKGMVLTSPTYLGVISPIKEISEYLHSIGKVLIVDEAHGAHLKATTLLPDDSISQGADISIQSFHKTLPALTQASVLHLNSKRVDRKKLESLLRIHQTSSPSYLIMASIDAAMNIMIDNGETLSDNLLDIINEFNENLESHKYLKRMTMKNSVLDPMRIVLVNKENRKIDFHQLEMILRRDYHIQVEYAYDKGIVLIPSIANTSEDFLKLSKALDSISFENLIIMVQCDTIEYVKPVKRMSIRDAFYSESKDVNITDSSKQVASEFIIPYPPGVPLLVPGEEIDSSIIQFVLQLNELGFNILGLVGEKKEKIAVIEED